MPHQDKEDIIKLVRHHYWSAIVNEKPIKMEAYPKVLSLENLNLLKILTQSDIKSRNNSSDKKIIKQLDLNYEKQKQIIHKYKILPKGRPLVFLEDNNYRINLAKNLNVPPEKIQSVVGVNELKFLLKEKFKAQNFMPGLNDANVQNGSFRTNLHMHTKNSDGDFTAQKLLDAVREYSRKISKPVYFAVTDHNNINANKEILELIAANPEKYKNLRFITGVEILNKHTAENAKEISYETIVYGLNPFKKGYKDFLSKQKIPKTSKELAEFYRNEDVLFPLAHPQRIFCDNLKNFIGDVFVPNNGKALEVHYSYSEAASEEWAKEYKFKPDETAISEVKMLAEEFQLLKTGGRDNHGEDFFHRRQKENQI
ncbi:MAG: hypothetical protein WCF95_01445 [bacterium]